MSKRSKNCLTIAQLIDKFKMFPQDWLVIVEGCDCYGEAQDVIGNDVTNEVLITRGKVPSCIANLYPGFNEEEG